MTNLFLKFADEAQANDVLYVYEPTAWDNSDPENPVATAYEPLPLFANIDIIGTIYKPTGEMLMGDDGEYPAMAALDGWHVNVLVVDEDASALAPYAVTPAVPVRVWG